MDVEGEFGVSSYGAGEKWVPADAHAECDEVRKDVPGKKLVGCSRAHQEILSMIERVAPTNCTVLITGESGVGKEVVARAIHSLSPRKEVVFLPVNCTAIPETLFESQLFGYVKGAFTGATACRQGFFKTAEGGTIFLDEIGEMPLGLQPKLLRAIEQREILPVGSSQPTNADFRIVTSTNRDLKKEVEERRFREDLYYRLNVIHIHVPPLRERREEIPVLVEHLIRRHNAEMGKAYKGVDNAALEILMSRLWRGNVRELDNVLERAMVLGNGEWIIPADLGQFGEKRSLSGPPADEHQGSLKGTLQWCEKAQIELAMKKSRGNKELAAKILGVSRSTLYRKIETLGIPVIFAKSKMMSCG